MGATSVTGVSGYGSVQDGLSKGSSHMSLGVSHLIGPRVLAAGTVTLASGTATVDHEVLSDITSNLVMLQPNAAHATFVASRTTSSFVITGTGTDVVSWLIVSTGTGVKVNN